KRGRGENSVWCPRDRDVPGTPGSRCHENHIASISACDGSGRRFLKGRRNFDRRDSLPCAGRSSARPLLRVPRSGINLFSMGDVTRILEQIEGGDKLASQRLFPLVYSELRRLAAAQMHRERPGQTLQATALVNEAYIRLVDVKLRQNWNSRSHFFAAAAE